MRTFVPGELPTPDCPERVASRLRMPPGDLAWVRAVFERQPAVFADSMREHEALMQRLCAGGGPVTCTTEGVT